MPTKKELLSSNKNIKEICDYLGANKKFFNIEGLYKALINEKRNNNNYPQFSDHYFTGEYPIKARQIRK